MKYIFYALGLLGLLNTWGRLAIDGTLLHLFHALHGAKDYILPDTTSLLHRNFTGIYWPIDYLLNILIVFFWEAVDGSHPATSAIGIYFLSQLFPILVAFYTEYFRRRQQQALGPSLIRPTIWLLSFQFFALGCTGFIWALTYTSSSSSPPTAAASVSPKTLRNASMVGDPRMVLNLLPALVIGYIFPAILMALPSPHIVSNAFQRRALVLWNLFPLSMFLLLKILGAMTSSSLYPLWSRSGKESAVFAPREHIRSIRIVNFIAMVMSAVVHVSILTLSISTVIFPSIFNEAYIADFSPRALFSPPMAIGRGETVGDGVRGFFLWDQVAGYPLMILVMMMQLRIAAHSLGVGISWVKMVGMAMGVSCIAGPGSACLALSWLRDEMLFGSGDEVKGEEK